MRKIGNRFASPRRRVVSSSILHKNGSTRHGYTTHGEWPYAHYMPLWSSHYQQHHERPVSTERSLGYCHYSRGVSFILVQPTAVHTVIGQLKRVLECGVQHRSPLFCGHNPDVVNLSLNKDTQATAAPHWPPERRGIMGAVGVMQVPLRSLSGVRFVLYLLLKSSWQVWFMNALATSPLGYKYCAIRPTSYITLAVHNSRTSCSS